MCSHRLHRLEPYQAFPGYSSDNMVDHEAHRENHCAPGGTWFTFSFLFVPIVHLIDQWQHWTMGLLNDWVQNVHKVLRIVPGSQQPPTLFYLRVCQTEDLVVKSRGLAVRQPMPDPHIVLTLDSMLPSLNSGVPIYMGCCRNKWADVCLLPDSVPANSKC